MHGAEGVGHEDVRKVSQLPGELGVVGLLLLLEAGVLEEHDLPVLHVGHAGLGALAHGVGGELDPDIGQQLTEALGHGGQGILHVHLALGTAQVGAKDHLRLMVQQILDGGHSGHDALIVRHLHVLGQGHVEVYPAQDPLTFYLNVFHSLFCHLFFLLLVFEYIKQAKTRFIPLHPGDDPPGRPFGR